MHTEKTVPRKAIVGLLLAVIALASALWLAELARLAGAQRCGSGGAG